MELDAPLSGLLGIELNGVKVIRCEGAVAQRATKLQIMNLKAGMRFRKRY